MKIDFKKINHSPLEFDLSDQDVKFKGNLKYHTRGLLLLDATLSGNIKIECDLCGSEFLMPIDESIEFFVSNGIHDQHDEELDVVEITGGIIDIRELLNSEIELFKSGYYRCENCKTEEERN
jgi:uncharacterized metal-binding protein YceD (DUF177 family)